MKKATWRKIKYPILIAGIKIFILTVRLLPRPVELFRFKLRGRLAYWIVKKERQKAIRHLTYAYGNEKSEKEIKTIARQVFENLAISFGDLAYSFNYKTKKEFLKIWEIQGEEHLEAAYQQGRGVLISTCHLGSWENSLIASPILGYKTSVVSAKLKNNKINDLIVAGREARGVKNIHRGKGKAMPVVLERLKAGECLTILIDQDIIAKGTFVNFYNKPAFTSVGAAKIAMEADVPVVTMVTRRLANNKYRVEYFPAFEAIKTGNYNNDLIENTKRIHAPLEELIKKYPEQWVWFHERWKRKPETIDPALVLIQDD